MTFRDIQNATEKRAQLDFREKYVHGDMWANGEGWIGPTASLGKNSGTHTGELVMGEIRKQFIFRNIIAEVMERHEAGVIGLAPTITLTPDGLTDIVLGTRDDEEEGYGGWFARKNVHKALQDATRNVLWASLDDRIARAPIRVYIPQRALTEGMVPREPIAQVLDRIEVTATSPRSSGLLRDHDGLPLLGYYYYTDDDDQQLLELTMLAKTLDDLELDLSGELSGLDVASDDDTLVLILDGRSSMVLQSAAYPLGGHLLMAELERTPLITEAAISQQKLFNLAYTMMGRNAVIAGFLEQTISNAQIPGEWVKDGKTVDEGTPGAEWKRSQYVIGPNVRSFIAGIPTYSEDGRTITGYTTPGIHERQPVTPQTFLETMQSAKTGIYEESDQLHVTITGDATASGRSRQQALQDFSMSLDLSIPTVKAATEHVIQTAVRLASVFATDGGQYANATVNARIEKNLMMEQLEEEDSNPLEDDMLFIERIEQAAREARRLNEAIPGLGLHWAHVMAARGAVQAPGAYLQGAIRRDDEGEDAQ